MRVISARSGVPQKSYLDDRTVREPAPIGPPVEMTAKWKDGKKTGRLMIQTIASSMALEGPREIKRVQDPAADPRIAATGPAQRVWRRAATHSSILA